MSSSHRLLAVFTLCMALACGLGVVAENPRHGKNEYFISNTWSLVPVASEPITSLSDLETGVYSIQLSGGRSGCGQDSNGPGMMIVIM